MTMSGRARRPTSVAPLSSTPAGSCPPWCVADHGRHPGEDDRVHTGEPIELADGILARLCLSVDPRTGAEDGPYVLVGWTEYTLDEAEGLGAALTAMAKAGRDATPP
jgi:hypothetical protein